MNDMRDPRDDDVATAILEYLATRLPAYPFKSEVDGPFVDELLDDFPDVDVLEEIKAFRWYYENQPVTRLRHPRVTLRRWIANARAPQR
jgi:hypothetical protein